MALESTVIGVLNILDVIQCLESTAIGDYQKKTLKHVFLKTLKLSLSLSLSLFLSLSLSLSLSNPILDLSLTRSLSRSLTATSHH